MLSTQRCDVRPRDERVPWRVILAALLALVFLAGCAGSTLKPGEVAPTTGVSSPLASLGPLPSAKAIVRGLGLRAGHNRVRIDPEDGRSGRPRTDPR